MQNKNVKETCELIDSTYFDLFVNRYNRLKKLYELNAPSVIVCNEAELIARLNYKNSLIRMGWSLFWQGIRSEFFWYYYKAYYSVFRGKAEEEFDGINS